MLLANAAELAPPVTPEGYVCQHLIDGLHGQMLSMKNGGSAITWAASLMDRQLLDADQIDQALDAVSPGSEGLRFAVAATEEATAAAEEAVATTTQTLALSSPRSSLLNEATDPRLRNASREPLSAKCEDRQREQHVYCTFREGDGPVILAYRPRPEAPQVVAHTSFCVLRRTPRSARGKRHAEHDE